MRHSLSLSGTALAVLLLAGTADASPASYPTPDAAVDALIAALEAQDKAALIAVFGPEAEDLVLTGDPEKDQDRWGGFMEHYREFHEIVPDGDARAVFYTGFDQWPFPAALVSSDGQWHFDAEGARDEILDRRIGLNELDVIDLLHRAVAVQDEYRHTDYDGDGVLEFAAAILSSEGNRDGLYWPDEAGTLPSPIGAFMAKAAAGGYRLDNADQDPDPYLGYIFRILQKQGPDAPGGVLDYVVNGNMVAGHAMLAYPADYGTSGVMTFMVGEAGVIYQSDLGDSTLETAGAIDSFNPGEGWEVVQE